MNLDAFEQYELDSQNLVRQLETLPGSYDGAFRPLAAPFAVIGFGEGALPAELVRTFMDENTAQSGGTQLILDGGFDFGAVEATEVIAEASNAKVFRMGQARRRAISVSEEEISYSLKETDVLLRQETDALSEQEAREDFFFIPSGTFSTYTYAQAVAYLTNHADQAEAADEALATLRERCKSEIPTTENPAKQLAWSLWTRTPVLLPASGFAVQNWVWQLALSRLGKSLSIPLVGNALEIVASGFEARHESGDALVALLLGGEDEALSLAREILETRVDEVIEVPAPQGEAYVANMGLWYLACWVGVYLALLYNQNPKDSKEL
ncbi:MAG: SIS domain-containing protein, partial [Deinococcales bacterium]